MGRRIIVYLTFTKDFDVKHDQGDVVIINVNESNVTVALFRNHSLTEIYRVETSLGRIVIAYSKRRKRIAKENSTKDREVRKKLKEPRVRGRKADVPRKTDAFIENLAIENKCQCSS